MLALARSLPLNFDTVGSISGFCLILIGKIRKYKKHQNAKLTYELDWTHKQLWHTSLCCFPVWIMSTVVGQRSKNRQITLYVSTNELLINGTRPRVRQLEYQKVKRHWSLWELIYSCWYVPPKETSSESSRELFKICLTFVFVMFAIMSYKDCSKL